MMFFTKKRKKGAAVVGGAGAGASSLLTDLVAGFAFDGAATDVLGNITLTPSVSAPTYDTGKINQAAVFVAASSQMFTGGNADLQFGDHDFTWAGWFYLNEASGSNRALIGRDNGSLREWLFLWNGGSNQLQWRIFNGSSQIGIATAGNPGGTTWFCAIGEYDKAAAKVRLRINNGAKSEGAVSGTPGTRDVPFYVGGPSAIGYHNGRQDALYFWNRLLTDDEHTSLYAGGAGLQHPF